MALQTEVVDAWVRCAEENVHAGRHEHRYQCPKTLAIKLNARRRTQKMRCLQVAEHVRRLLSSTESEETPSRIVKLSRLNRICMSYATYDQLRSVANSGNRDNIRPATALCADEGEEEGEEDCEQRDSNVLLVLESEDEAREEDGENHTPTPHPDGYLLVDRCRIVDEISLIQFLFAE